MNHMSCCFIWKGRFRRTDGVEFFKDADLSANWNQRISTKKVLLMETREVYRDNVFWVVGSSPTRLSSMVKVKWKFPNTPPPGHSPFGESQVDIRQYCRNSTTFSIIQTRDVQCQFTDHWHHRDWGALRHRCHQCFGASQCRWLQCQ
jgi:hypothetical protein